MAAANTSFYVTTGAEIHWRQAHYFHRDFASIKTLLAGLTGLLVVEVLFVLASWMATPYLYNCMTRILFILRLSASSWRRPFSDTEMYEQVADDENKVIEGSSHSFWRDTSEDITLSKRKSLLRVTILVPSVLTVLLYCIRPPGASYAFLSQTLLISPFGGPTPHTGDALIEIPSSLGDYSWLGNRTALGAPPKFDWLPVEELAGFRDWYASSNGTPGVHYNPAQDPLHISNLDGDVIEPLCKVLQDGSVKIKHIFLVKMESTREDVFPIRKDSFMHNRIRQSYSGQIPADVEGRLANLTTAAERLTGTSSGFGDPVKPYGGITATNSHTAGTFTLKSLTGTICGLAPLVVDFNREYLNHIYQPCIPHVLEALNIQQRNGSTDDFTSWPWRSSFMQTITDLYDNQNLLTPRLGFQESVNVDTLEASAKSDKINFWGYPDNELRHSFRDAINNAEKNHERLFVSHLTGITHYPWDMPYEEYEEMCGSTYLPFNKKLNRYLNTLGFVDRWYAEIMDILEETGVANETLLVMTGDHGITLPEDGGVTPCDNPHVSNFHVPLVLAHPQIPPIKLDSPVTSMQILPTILDLLKESSSLDEPATHAITDLLPLYEGQSMIRPLIAETQDRQDWQFSTMNTGGTWLALRSAAKPYRLVIPLIPDVEWRFSDVSVDPTEKQYLISFDLVSLVKQVDARQPEAVQWVKDAAHVAQWWVAENWRRYEYVP